MKRSIRDIIRDIIRAARLDAHLRAVAFARGEPWQRHCLPPISVQWSRDSVLRWMVRDGAIVLTAP